MRKSFSIIILALIAAVSLYAAAGCKNDSPPEVAAASIVLSADTLQLNEYVAPQATLTATVLDAEGNVLAGKTVTWRSDNESVATVSGGVVTYVGAGNAAITAASGEIIKACAVTATSASPYLQVGEDSIGLKSGATAKLEVSAKYNGEAFTAGIIEFAVANPAIATVSGGAVTGVSEGTTTVTVTLKLGDVVLDSAEIEVTVTYDVELTLEADITTIYTYALPALNAAFVNTATLESGLIIEGTPSQNALTFRSSNASVATVSNGIVTALAAGTARIKAEYVHQGVTFSSPEILFTVEKAAVTKEEKVRVFVEDSIIAGSAFFMNDGYAVIGAYDFDADIERSRNYYDGGLDTDALTNDLHGERTWIIECEEYLVICPVLVVTNRISTTDDLKNVFNDSDGTKSIVFNGYYLLMNNIDASAYAHYNQQYGSAADSRGLTDGTFDGDGYTISGITLNNGGLFGRVIRSTVKNLALADVKLIGSNNYTSIFGNYGTQSSTVENVFISMSWGAATGYVSVFGRYFSGNTVKSLVVVINDMPADISKYMILSNEGNNTNSFSKTYIVSRFEKLLGANTTIGGISKFDTVAEMAAAGLSYGLSGTYWNSAAQVIPVFKTSLAYINASAFDFGAYGTFNLESNEKLNINLSIAGVSLPTANEYVGINGTEISIGNYLNFDEDLTVTVRLTYAFNAASYKDITLKISAIAASTLEVTAPVIIDLYGIPDNYILNNASLNAADGYRIYLVNPAGVKAVLAGTLTAGEVAITKASLLAAGEGLGAGYTLRIVTAALDLRYTAVTVRQEIDTAAKLKSFSDASYTAAVESRTLVGLYILTANIDASSVVTMTNWVNAEAGFGGILDGQGYAVDKFKPNAYGLFGTTNKCTVRNIAFTNVSRTGDYIFGAVLKGATVTNVMIEVASCGSKTVGLLAKYIQASGSKSSVFTNFVMILPSSYAGYIMTDDWNNGTTYTNFKLVTTSTLFAKSGNTTIPASVNAYASAEALAAANVTSAFTAAVWSQVYKLPVFVTAVPYIEGTVNAAATVASGDTLFTGNYYRYTVSGTGAALISIVNGALTVGQNAATEALAAEISVVGILTGETVGTWTVDIAAAEIELIPVTYSDAFVIDLYKDTDSYTFGNAGIEAEDVTSAYVIDSAEGRHAVNATVIAGQIVLTGLQTAVSDGVGAGYSIVIEASKSVITLSTVTIRQEIDTAAKLKRFSDASYTAAGAGLTITGLYMLTANIDASSVVTLTVWKNAEAGFGGILDGQGYTIDKFTANSYGLFATTNRCTVRNIAFTNTGRTGDYILGAVVKGITVTNVMLEIVSYGSRTTGLLAKYIQAGTVNSVFTNFVMIVPSSYTGYIMTDDWHNGTTYTNFKLVTTSTLFAKSGNTTIPASVNAYASLEALAAANVTPAFTASVWSQVYKLPVFVTAAQYIAGTVNAAATVASGDTLFTGNYYRYTVSGTGAALISIVNGALTVGQNAETEALTAEINVIDILTGATVKTWTLNIAAAE